MRARGDARPAARCCCPATSWPRWRRCATGVTIIRAGRTVETGSAGRPAAPDPQHRDRGAWPAIPRPSRRCPACTTSRSPGDRVTLPGRRRARWTRSLRALGDARCPRPRRQPRRRWRSCSCGTTTSGLPAASRRAMSAAVCRRRAPAPAAAGTAVLVGAALRRDRRRLAGLGAGRRRGWPCTPTVALGAVYPTAADRQARAAVMRHARRDPAERARATAPRDYTLGAMIANELALSVMVAVAIMAIPLVVRHTRAEEEDGARRAGARRRGGPPRAARRGAGGHALAELAVARRVSPAGWSVAGLAARRLGRAGAAASAYGPGVRRGRGGDRAAVRAARGRPRGRRWPCSALAVGGARGRGHAAARRQRALLVLADRLGAADAGVRRPAVAPLVLSVVARPASWPAGAYALAGRRDVGAGLFAARPRSGGGARPGWPAPAALIARLQAGVAARLGRRAGPRWG